MGVEAWCLGVGRIDAGEKGDQAPGLIGFHDTLDQGRDSLCTGVQIRPLATVQSQQRSPSVFDSLGVATDFHGGPLILNPR